jgi:hypothetical protein
VRREALPFDHLVEQQGQGAQEGREVRHHLYTRKGCEVLV